MNEADDLINPDKKALGARLRKLRESFSWTLGELSEATKHLDPTGDGISKVSISRYENGDSYPGYREIKLLAQAFAVPVSSLFYGDIPDPYAGWEMSLDDYLRSVIKSVLIEEGLIKGESRADREQKQMLALRAIQGRRRPIVLESLDEEDKAERTRLDEKAQSELEELTKKLSQPTKTKPKTR
ncbi:helix-turn-helix domain-containing protein [Simplicispira lacusdiani]|uniref:helix-turn-helix domain-containing protein n=1 Tax=Simplicispira lacusdiani TaxID=2213010 RepID=UPI00130074EF|nr:helix-turn-helix transcriptional regulator [Simplicispira lacusdiani]